MSETPSRAAVNNWARELVTSKLPPGERCGDARAEFPAGSGPVYPYHVLYSVPGGYVSGPPMGQAQGDALFLFQLDSVGLTRDQAEQAADRARNWLVGRTIHGEFVVQPPDPDGVRIHDRIVDGTPGAPLQEGQPPREVFTVSETYGIHVSVT